MKHFPWITTSVAAAAALVPFVAADGVLQYDRAAILRGEVWRLATAHLAHWSSDHLFWDVVTFMALGIVCERRSLFFGAVLLATALTVSLLLLLACPQVAMYRGLSAIDSTVWMWTAMIVAGRSTTAASMLVACFYAKVLVELSTGSSVFASGITVLPSVHLVGAAIGFCGAMAERWMWRVRGCLFTSNQATQGPSNPGGARETILRPYLSWNHCRRTSTHPPKTSSRTRRGFNRWSMS